MVLKMSKVGKLLWYRHLFITGDSSGILDDILTKERQNLVGLPEYKIMRQKYLIL